VRVVKQKLSPAASAFRAGHGAITVVFLGAIVHIWWCALTGRLGRWLRLAVVAILGEGAFVAVKCRLGGATTLA